jgi:type IV secretory pathway TraG/TraD family ATPase VirD4
MITYMCRHCAPQQQSLVGILKLIREKTGNKTSAMDCALHMEAIFRELVAEDPDSFAVKQYDNFCMEVRMTDKTLQRTLASCAISCAVRLQVFDLWDVQELTKEDDIDLESVCKEKTALFIITPTNDTAFDYIAAMMYVQLFDVLAGHRNRRYMDEPFVHTHLFIDMSQMIKIPDLWKRLEAVKEHGVTSTLFIDSPEIMTKYYKGDWGRISEAHDAALLLSPKGMSMRDWFQKYTGLEPQGEDSTEKERFLGFLNRVKKANSTDACLEDIRMLSEDECLVAVKGAPVKKMLKYAAKSHPSWSVVKNGR